MLLMKLGRRRSKLLRNAVLLVIVGFVLIALLFPETPFLHFSQHDSIKDIPIEVLNFESHFIPNAGHNGRPHSIPSQTKEEIDAIVQKHAFNKAVSDQIDVKRALPDFRHKECIKRQDDYGDLSNYAASVILIFNGEALSALLRTVWSLLTNTPDHLLHEIILIDDGSTSDELTKVLPLYIKARLPEDKVKLHVLGEQTGLIRARTAGARFATGRVIVFLDSHCEATTGWLPPLLDPIRSNNSTITIPSIDSISDKTLSYYGSHGGSSYSVGTFTWSGHFSWMSYDGEERSSPADPIPSPTMAGGLFAMSRDLFWSMGGYDEGMIGWGGENLELSFRTWRCGGRMESVPCSNVGHIFRSFHPYFIPKDSHGVNTARMAEVWMDDYKRFFYLYRTDLRSKAPSRESLASRHALKTKLKCKSFSWYLHNVLPSKFRMDEEGLHWGRVSNGQYPKMCLDHLQRDMGHNQDTYLMGQYPCHEVMGSSQYYIFTKDGTFRNEYMCGNVLKDKKLSMVPCFTREMNNPGWSYDMETKHLMHKATGLCLTMESDAPSEDVVARECVDSDKRQMWTFEISR